LEPKVIIIVGPTCSGKTTLAILLAEKLNTEIISADSRQIYKYLDIGTAKPDREQLDKIKHHFISILEPGETYNVSRFEIDAIEVIQNLLGKSKIPIVVGGSGLYIKALIDGIFDADTNEELRNNYLEQRRIYGNECLYEELKNVDPESAAKMLPQNWKRVMRALEVFKLTGTAIGAHHREQKKNQNKFNFVQFGLRWNRQELYKNIENRVDEMIAAGLVNETELLLEKYNRNLNSLNTVGYKEIIAYLDNQITLDRAVELIKRNTRRYAKRQLTWFNADERIKWYDVFSAKDLEMFADEIACKEINK
jgi:tRNA dimethylallyltransferase